MDRRTKIEGLSKRGQQSQSIDDEKACVHDDTDANEAHGDTHEDAPQKVSVIA